MICWTQANTLSFSYSLSHTHAVWNTNSLSLSLSLPPPSLSHTHTDCVSLVRHRHTLKHSLTHKHTLFHSQNTHSLSLVVKRRCCVGVVPLKIFGFLFFLKNWWSKKKKNIDDLRAFFHKSATHKKAKLGTTSQKRPRAQIRKKFTFCVVVFFWREKTLILICWVMQPKNSISK